MKDSNLRNPGPKPGGIAANRTRVCCWWTNGESNPGLRGASAMFSQLYYQPIVVVCVGGFEPPAS